MIESAEKALLPAGMSDVLAPDAAFEAAALERLMTWFARHGYDRVKPPLIEFETGLLTGMGAGLGGQTFRLMDPVSQKMMGVRADITPQIARIARARLKHAPRPLRLGYAGDVLRVTGSQLRPERQFTQAGVELIGADAPAADAELIVMAAGALAELGVAGLSVDLGLPTLVPAILGSAGRTPELGTRLRQALDRKDGTAVSRLGKALGKDIQRTLAALLAAAGPAAETLAAINRLGLGRRAARERRALAEVVERVHQGAPGLMLTIDPVENRGFEYHTGVTFTFFARGVRGELGSGGRYMAGSEPATGLTLFMDTVLRALPRPKSPSRVYLPASTPAVQAAKLRAAGWIAVGGLADGAAAEKDARRLGCSHILARGKPRPLTKSKNKG
ncbi:MAG TPA: ATP phosphoribosyltransferase regulatory subunit [Rhodospirillales bacterium]